MRNNIFNDKELIKFAKEFSKSYNAIDKTPSLPKDFFSDNKNYNIRCFTGEQGTEYEFPTKTKTLFRVGNMSGRIEFDIALSLKHEEFQNEDFIFFYILWCAVRHLTKTEFEADAEALEYYKSTYRSHENIFVGFEKICSLQSEETITLNAARLKFYKDTLIPNVLKGQPVIENSPNEEAELPREGCYTFTFFPKKSEKTISEENNDLKKSLLNHELDKIGLRSSFKLSGEAIYKAMDSYAEIIWRERVSEEKDIKRQYMQGKLNILNTFKLTQEFAEFNYNLLCFISTINLHLSKGGEGEQIKIFPMIMPISLYDNFVIKKRTALDTGNVDIKDFIEILKHIFKVFYDYDININLDLLSVEMIETLHENFMLNEFKP